MTKTIEKGVRVIIVNNNTIIGGVLTGKITITTPHSIVTENDVEDFDSYVNSLVKNEEIT